MHQADSCPIKHAIWINSILLLSLYGKANPLFVVFVISRPSAISGAFSVPGLELLICPLPEAAAGSNLQGRSSACWGSAHGGRRMEPGTAVLQQFPCHFRTCCFVPSSVWSPHYKMNFEVLERVQRRSGARVSW